MNESKFFKLKSKIQELRNPEPFAYRIHEDWPGVTSYIFKNVVIIIDQQKKEKPPLLQFRTYARNPNKASLNQPAFPRKGVDMEYIVRCIQKVADDTGVRNFRITSWSADSERGSEDRRREARIRLYKGYVNLHEDPDDEGSYILSI